VSLVSVINQTEGTKFRQFCSIQKGSSPLFFQWTKNEQILSSKPEVNYKIETSDEHSIIIISNVRRSDAGNYSCIVRNAFGTDSQTVSLNVRGIHTVLILRFQILIHQKKFQKQSLRFG
jgi:hypothetical protein